MSETLTETVELDADEANELLFKVNVEGHVSSPAKIRLVCEAENVSYAFPGRPSTDGLVQFVISKDSGMKEGMYPAKIEVLIENRYFVPVKFNVNLKKQVQVFAEAVQFAKPVKQESVLVSAQVVSKPKPEPKPVVIEGPPKIELEQATATVVPVVPVPAPVPAKVTLPPVKPTEAKTLRERWQLRKNR